MLWVVMAECCNNELVQNSYSKFGTAFLDIIIEVKNSLFDALETSQSSWTEIITTALLTAHIIFLILFFCSRSLIAPFKE